MKPPTIQHPDYAKLLGVDEISAKQVVKHIDAAAELAARQVKEQDYSDAADTAVRSEMDGVQSP